MRRNQSHRIECTKGMTQKEEMFQTRLTGMAKQTTEAPPTQRTEKERAKVKGKEKEALSSTRTMRNAMLKEGDSTERKSKCPQDRKS